VKKAVGGEDNRIKERGENFSIQREKLSKSMKGKAGLYVVFSY